MWEDLQNHVTEDTIDLSEEAEQFSEWVTSVDFSEIMNRSSPSTRDRLVRAVYRNTPYRMFNGIHTVYRTIKKRRRLRRIVGKNWMDWQIETIESEDEH